MSLKLSLLSGLQGSLLMSGMLTSLIGNNPLSMWIGLELKMFSVLPFLMVVGTNLFTYFVVQSLGTSLFLIGIMEGNYSILIILGLSLKLGLLPYYSWFMDMIQTLPWGMIWLMSTIQKFHLLVLMSGFLGNSNVIGLVTSIIVSLHLSYEVFMNKMNRSVGDKVLVGYLSMMDASVLLILLNLKFSFGLLYFVGYTVLLSVVVYYLEFGFNTGLDKIKFSLSVLSLSGFPPFLGFFLKVSVISYLGSVGSSVLLMPFSVGLSVVFFVLFPLLIQFIGYLVLLLKNIPYPSLDSHLDMSSAIVFVFLLMLKWLFFLI